MNIIPRARSWIIGAAIGLNVLPVIAEDAAAGRALYLKHCATCHGLEANGFGPLAEILAIMPADLNQLAAANNQIFPVSRVVARVDGRDPLVSHGSDMPVYGDFYEGKSVAIESEAGQTITTSPAMRDLVAYLKTLRPE